MYVNMYFCVFFCGDHGDCESTIERKKKKRTRLFLNDRLMKSRGQKKENNKNCMLHTK